VIAVANGGRAFGRFEAALGVVGIGALVVSYSLITGWNPLNSARLPQVWSWIASPSSLSKPATAWIKRSGSQPSSAVVTGSTAVVVMRETVEARDIHTGEVRWTRQAGWGAVAGSDGNAVAVVAKSSGHGYDVIEPDTGHVRWSDGAAIGAWTFQDAILSLTCPWLADCSLAFRAPLDGTVRWKTTLPGIGRVLAGANQPLLGSRQLTPSYQAAGAASPDAVPHLLGFPLDRRVQVLDTSNGKLLKVQSPNETTRVDVIGDRVLLSTAVRQGSSCRYTLAARDPASGKQLWHKDGYDLRTASGAGCEQRRDPGGSGGVLVATRYDNREAFLSAATGGEVWVAAPGESILATDGRYGLVRSADHKSIKEIDLPGGGVRWTRPAPPKSLVGLTRHAVFINDTDDEHLVAVDPASQRTLLDVKTSATVLGVGPTGIVLSSGRTIGYLPYG
jgi:hypothetical protein